MIPTNLHGFLHSSSNVVPVRAISMINEKLDSQCESSLFFHLCNKKEP